MIAVHGDLKKRTKHLHEAVLYTPESDLAMLGKVEDLRLRLEKLGVTLMGDATRSRRDIETEPSLLARMESPIWSMWNATSAPSESTRASYLKAGQAFEKFLADLRIVQSDLEQSEKQLNDLGAPYTPGRMQIPDWKLD